jgi:hypothetical protein
MKKKIMYVLFGFVLGFIATNAFFVPELMAQYGLGASGTTFSVTEIRPAVPAGYGNLVAVSDLKFYFQDKDGNIHILSQRTPTEWNTQITVIKRGE